jgi:hypothetical protein
VKHVFKASHFSDFGTSCRLSFKGLSTMFKVRLPDGILPGLCLWTCAGTSMGSTLSFTLHRWFAALGLRAFRFGSASETSDSPTRKHNHFFKVIHAQVL